MRKNAACPVCGKICRVATDGQSGYCKTRKQPWKKEKVQLADIRPGPLVHEALPQPLLEVARWTFEVVGRFIQPTFEQWELGFLRDANPARELGIWARVANAYTAFLKSKDRDLKSIAPEEGRWLICWLLDGNNARPLPLELVEKVKDEAVRTRLVDLNRPEVIEELQAFGRKSDPSVPSEFIEGVKDESVRKVLWELNQALQRER